MVERQNARSACHDMPLDLSVFAVFIIALALIFDFTNGMHDAANSISTVVSTRVLAPKYAVLWAAFFNFIAFMIFGTAVAKTIGAGMVDIKTITPVVIFCGLLGAIGWNFFTWCKGLPTSSSHALIGGYAGAAVANAGTESLIAAGLLRIGSFIVLAPLIGLPLPFTPFQILWMNLVTDGLPGLALTVEPAERDTMQRPPHSPKENIFGRGMGRDILVIGLIMGLISLGVGYFAWLRGDPAWQTMAFTTLTMAQMGNALAVRSERYSLWQIGLFSNRLILGAVLLTFALQMMVVYVPFFQNIFSTMPLTITDLVISLGCAVLVYFSIEVYKIIVNRR